nr:hypothetical protein [Wenxinia marina]
MSTNSDRRILEIGDLLSLHRAGHVEHHRHLDVEDLLGRRARGRRAQGFYPEHRHEYRAHRHVGLGRDGARIEVLVDRDAGQKVVETLLLGEVVDHRHRIERLFEVGRRERRAVQHRLQPGAGALVPNDVDRHPADHQDHHHDVDHEDRHRPGFGGDEAGREGGRWAGQQAGHNHVSTSLFGPGQAGPFGNG